MAVLSLLEAAEEAKTSKVDVWRAIQEGALPARKTSDGGYAIDPADLFRVFERKQPEPEAGCSVAASAPDVAVKETEASEPAADDVSVAFAALQAELQSLLGSPGKAGTGEDVRRGELKDDFDGLAGQPRTDAGAAAANPRTVPEAAPGQARAAEACPAERRRPWWRR